MNDSFRNLKLTSSFETTTKYYVTDVFMNAQTSRFRQLEVRSDLSNYRALPGQYSFVFTQRLGSAFSMHIYIHTYITGAYIALSNNMIKALYNEQIIIIIINYIYIALKTYF